MAETYCGKDCAQCTYQADLACPGCKAGPGKTFGGECSIADCCQKRGHNTCDTCNQRSWCGKARDYETMADIRLQKQQREQAKRAQLEKRIPMLAKSLTLIFWLTIASILPGLMSNDLTLSLPGLYRTGKVLNLVLSLAIMAIYFRLGAVNSRYRKAALYMAVGVVANTVVTWITGGETPAWTLLVTLPVAVMGFVGRYNLYSAHSEILVPVEYALSESWMSLWKWYIGLFAVLIASILLVVILPILGALAALIAAIGTAVVSIMEVIYLYRMMARFRTYARELAA